MIKTWLNNQKGEDKIIAFDDSNIYKANPKQDKIDQCINDLNNKNYNEDIVNIPYNYIRYIKYREGTNNIVIYYGKNSKSYLRIKDKKRIKEIFNSFRKNIPDIFYQLQKYSILKTLRKQLIGLTVTLYFFLQTYISAEDFKNGLLDENSFPGSMVLVLVYSIASLGKKNVILIFSILVILIVFSSIRKMIKRSSSEHKLFFVWKP